MHVELLQFLMGFLFIAVWAMVGSMIVRHRHVRGTDTRQQSQWR